MTAEHIQPGGAALGRHGSRGVSRRSDERTPRSRRRPKRKDRVYSQRVARSWSVVSPPGSGRAVTAGDRDIVSTTCARRFAQVKVPMLERTRDVAHLAGVEVARGRRMREAPREHVDPRAGGSVASACKVA